MTAPAALKCPVCRAPLALEDVNVEKDMVLCRSCSHMGTLSEISREKDDERVLETVPCHISVFKTMHGLVLSCRRPKKYGFFLLIFALFWDFIVSCFLYVMVSGKSYTVNGVEKTGIDDGTLLFLIPFLLVGIVALLAAVVLLFGGMKLTLNPGRGELFRGIGPIGIRRRFRLAKDTRIMLEERMSSGSSGSTAMKEISIRQTDGKPFRFGRTLVDEDMLEFIAATLRKWRE